MDELFRMTPAERRRKRLLVLGAVVVLALLALTPTAISTARRVIRERNQPVPPGAYLVALAPGARVSLNGKSVPLGNSLAVPANTAIALARADAARVAIVFSKDGRIEIPGAGTNANSGANAVAGPVTLRAAAPAQSESESDALSMLAATREKLAAAPYNGPPESTGRVLVTSPFGVTRYTNPVITWEPRPGIRYDIAVLDPSDPESPPRIALNMLPPVRVDQLDTTQDRVLTTDRIYLIIIREAGSETQVGIARFLVSPDATGAAPPSAPAELLLEAVRALTASPARTGDAWLALSRLPADWAGTELALRLRICAAGTLGLAGEFETARRDLAALGIKN
jgi:hypothetical protein